MGQFHPNMVQVIFDFHRQGNRDGTCCTDMAFFHPCSHAAPGACALGKLQSRAFANVDTWDF